MIFADKTYLSGDLLVSTKISREVFVQFLSNNVTGTMANLQRKVMLSITLGMNRYHELIKIIIYVTSYLLFWKLCGTWAWWLKLMSTICVVTSASGLGFSCSSQVFVKRTGGFSVGIYRTNQTYCII